MNIFRDKLHSYATFDIEHSSDQITQRLVSHLNWLILLSLFDLFTKLLAA